MSHIIVSVIGSSDLNDDVKANTVLIHGPIISSSDLDAHAALFAAFGLVEVARCDRTATETQAIWGIDGQSSVEITLGTPGTEFGLRLIRFDPGSTEQIRSPSRGSDCDALKVIDFYAPDLTAAKVAIEQAGFSFKPEIATYETPEGMYQEAHLWGPDGVVCALISGDRALFDDMATVRDRLVSEPQSISGPVQDQDATLAFLDQVLGLGVIHQYGLEDPSFDAMVGSAAQLRLRAWNVGTRKDQPYLGVINYGLAPASQHSLFTASTPPNRGLLGVTVVVQNASSVATAAKVGTVRTSLPGFGDVLMATMQGPNGAWYQAIERVDG